MSDPPPILSGESSHAAGALDNPRAALVVVQSSATQFDGPFFRFLHAAPVFNLTVCYTDSSTALRPYDPELNRHPDWDNDMTSGYPIRIYPRSLPKRIWMSLSVVLKRPGLIILSGWRSFDNLLILFVALLVRVPVGIRSDNCFIGYRERSGQSGKRFLLRCLLRLFSTAHPVGSLAAEYLTTHGLNPARIFPFPYLVDQDRLRHLFSEALIGRGRLRSEFGISEGDFVVLGVMKFIDREDPLTLLNAFVRLAASIPSGHSGDRRAHLVLVGDGELRSEIERRIRDSGIADITLPGYVAYSRLPEFFALADVLVHPARQESWGVTVNEALACGLPVIAADTVGSAHDLIVSGINGFTFPRGSEQALAAMLQRLFCDPELMAQVKAQSVDSPALSRFSYTAIQTNLSRALDFVLRPTRPASLAQESPEHD